MFYIRYINVCLSLYLSIYIYMGTRHNACLKGMLHRVHSPVGEKTPTNGTDDRLWVENVKRKIKNGTSIK